MPLRNKRPITWRAAGLTDSLDGTNAFSGAMSSLANLVPAPGNLFTWVPRVASLELVDFSATFNTPTFISLQKVIGTRVYGFVTTARFPGFDEPFCYDVIGRNFVPIAGVNANNVPRSPLTTGDWTPPTLAAPTNSRIVGTHPGFAGAGPLAPFFGWFDISSFEIKTLLGNTTSGSNVITSINDGFTSAPIIDGIQPGQVLKNAVALGFPAGTTVTMAANGLYDNETTCNTDGTFTITDIVNVAGLQPGMGVSGPLFAPASVVVSVDIAAQTAVLNFATLGNGTATPVIFSGGGTITVSANCSTTANQVALDIAGGTFTNPLWGAGNTNTFPLSSIPAAVGSYNTRAWFLVRNGAVFSDALNPTQVTNASQALILGDNTPCTALAGLPLVNTVTGGAVASLIIFKGAGDMYQISGDAATSNLAQNVIEGSVGTLAPLTITSVPEGLAYVAVDGLRILNLSGTLGEPIGAYGEGVNAPLIGALYPSRMCASYGQNTIRISLQRGDVPGTPWQEVCYDMRLKKWHGPHSFPASLIDSVEVNGMVGFVLTAQGQGAKLWFHSLVPTPNSQYIENGGPIPCTWATALLPDNQAMEMNFLLETALALIAPPQIVFDVTFTDEGGVELDEVAFINTNPTGAALWGKGVWGQFIWGSLKSYFRQYTIPWTDVIVFKQGFVTVTFTAAQGIALGNLYLGYQILGYMLEDETSIVGFTAITATQYPDTSYTAIAGVELPDGSFTAILATLVEQQSGYP